MQLEGKVALVTGGGTGLGREISLQLARRGVDVAVNYSRSTDDANTTVRDIKALGRRAIAVQADVSNADDVRRMVARVVADLGSLQILINNAGTTVFVPFKDLGGISEDDWDRVQDVNVKGSWLCAGAAAPHMKNAGEGRIVLTTSISGLRAGGSSIAYAVSKAGMQMLSRCLALALAPEITVNTVAPGIMDTRWGERWGQEALDRMAREAPLQRYPSLHDIAAGAVFLCESDSMTGQTLVIDAGRHMPL
ncbi:MAG: SDR family oxidoreductase [Chloroflexota bacterium]|nr:MAG: SDR family oxidoreductase [Chloroflexota bacterium]